MERILQTFAEDKPPTTQRQNLLSIAVIGVWLILPIAFIANSPDTLTAILHALPFFAFPGFLKRVVYHLALTQALAHVDDIRFVGLLVDRLHSARTMQRRRYRVVRQALMRLLPRLKASDTSLLTPEQKRRLARHLLHLALFQRDSEFQVVILRAFEQVGDAQAIPIVESVIQRRPRWAGHRQVHAAAVECLPFLRQRAQEENVRTTLLRVTGQNKVYSDQLLRPADGTTEVGVHDLLRADPSSERTTP